MINRATCQGASTKGNRIRPFGQRHCQNAALKHATIAHEYQEFRMRVMAARASVTGSVSIPESIAPESTSAPPPELPPISYLDIRVGKILKCELHPDADTLYVEQIDVGETEPRTIVSGLVKYMPLDQMQDRPVIILCNLKPRNMRGIKSNGMVLCASDESHECVEPLMPPEGAKIGQRIWFGEEGQNQAAAAEPNRIDKKKIWEALQPHLRTDEFKVANFQRLQMLTGSGPVTALSLPNACVS
ncbi:hypothetical protein CEUSTIGMA_g11171.t1 [Chlamydomonas eustigma]|uniref:tRNA-binding domain-containing protein n=1 Tax=Chlamydomonas eustigma TaxID=1157962 RepID=A0A250XL39_9CHLO|nr:hypothetical protein CEUSTIGMA_g11171.t1 [Chlamydomonas eustigma]|eukprot:GAX83746.1 hypothetical protein CEUSTIGMA_g11171.t1 [Chlamydomonas eustigma]